MAYVLVRKRANFTQTEPKSELEWYMDYGNIFGEGRWEKQEENAYHFPMPFPDYSTAAKRLATLMEREVFEANDWDDQSVWDWWYTISEYHR